MKLFLDSFTPGRVHLEKFILMLLSSLFISGMYVPGNDPPLFLFGLLSPLVFFYLIDYYFEIPLI